VSDLSDRLHDALRAIGGRLTPQRRLILQVLEASDEHLDAEALYDRVRARDPDVSLATVYRTLAILREIGLVEEHRLGEDHAHFEAVRDEPHYHFTCLRCGNVIEFDTDLVAQIEQSLHAQEGVRVVSSQLHIQGYCASCLADSRELPTQTDLSFTS
jgi:Fur family ferric uptake transcriptional regulator